MIAHRQILRAAALLSLVGHGSAAVARASQASHDPPWNFEHISQLPEEIRKALTDDTRQCKGFRSRFREAPLWGGVSLNQSRGLRPGTGLGLSNYLGVPTPAVSAHVK
jgi:hypothetical protein